MPDATVQKTTDSSARGLSGLIRRRFFLLFLFLLVTLAIYPWAENSASGYVAFRIAGSVVVLLSVYAIGFRRGVVIFGLLLAVPAILKHALSLQPNAGVLPFLSVCLSFGFDVFIIVVMFRRVFSREKPNSETVFGALCIYLLVGFSFASVYEMLEALRPHAFYLDPRTNTHLIPDRFDFIYYSFGTMTAMGASGISAAIGQARALTIIQAMLGIFYLAVLISRLIGGYRGTPVR